MRKASVFVLILALVAVSASMRHRPFQEMTEADSLWYAGNELYQQEKYRQCLPYFNKALTLYEKDKDKQMITTTQVCLGYAYFVMDEEYTARVYAYSIDWDYPIKDGQWNRVIADLFNLLGDGLMEAKYLKRAREYGYR